MKYLRLEGCSHIKDIAKTALLLEAALPDLEITGLDYGLAVQNLEDEFRLLTHERVTEDARGNLHIQDDCGEVFYVGGNLSER